MGIGLQFESPMSNMSHVNRALRQTHYETKLQHSIQTNETYNTFQVFSCNDATRDITLFKLKCNESSGVLQLPHEHQYSVMTVNITSLNDNT
jgi:hypothetical protein